MENRYGHKNIFRDYACRPVANLNKCDASSEKIPNGIVHIGSNGVCGSERVIFEEIYQQENLDLLLRRAKILFNQLGHNNYVLKTQILFWRVFCASGYFSAR